MVHRGDETPRETIGRGVHPVVPIRVVPRREDALIGIGGIDRLHRRRSIRVGFERGTAKREQRVRAARAGFYVRGYERQAARGVAADGARRVEVAGDWIDGEDVSGMMAPPAVPDVRYVAARGRTEDPHAPSKVAHEHRASPEGVGSQPERAARVQDGGDEAAAVRRSAEQPSRRARKVRVAVVAVAVVVVVVPERREIRVEFLPGGPLDEPARDESGRGGDLAAHDVPVQALDAVGGVATAVAAGR